MVKEIEIKILRSDQEEDSEKRDSLGTATSKVLKKIDSVPAVHRSSSSSSRLSSSSRYCVMLIRDVMESSYLNLV